MFLTGKVGNSYNEKKFPHFTTCCAVCLWASILESVYEIETCMRSNWHDLELGMQNKVERISKDDLLLLCETEF